MSSLPTESYIQRSPSRRRPSREVEWSPESSIQHHPVDPYPSPRPSPSPQISPTTTSIPSFFPPVHSTPQPRPIIRHSDTALSSRSTTRDHPSATDRPQFPLSSPIETPSAFATPLPSPYLPTSSSFPSSSHTSLYHVQQDDPSPSSPRSRSSSVSSSQSSISTHDPLTSHSGPSLRQRRPPAVYSSLPSSPTKGFLSLGPEPSPFDLDLANTYLTKGKERESSVDVPDFQTVEEAVAPKSGGVVEQTDERETRNPSSLWEYLQEEIWANEFDSHQEMKWERVSNFVQVPLAIEKIIVFGCLVCLDSFLYVFTILPIRSMIACFVVVRNYWTSIIHRKPRRLVAPSQKIDILKFMLLLLSCVILVWGTDASYMYHSIRGQDSIKLVVIFNAFEIADRLCGAFGQDVLDSLFARETLSRRPNGSQPHMRPIAYFLLSLGYVLAHALVYFYQLISLNVAINSYDNALLTLLLSNQFVEIKGSVFKKFEKENLFQIACADIVERFQLGLMLSVIALRNLIEMSGSDFTFLPKSFIRGKGNFETILSPALIVLGSEMAVDWVKHAYITKFNHIRVSVYQRYTDVLCRDLVTAGVGGRPARKKHLFADQSPLVSRRLGFAPLPLACLVIRVGMQAIGMASQRVVVVAEAAPEVDAWLVGAKWAAIGLGGVVCWACLVAFKIILGINLLNFASRRFAGMQERKLNDDDLNSVARSPLGEGIQEKYNKELSNLLDRPLDDIPFIEDIPTLPKKPTPATMTNADLPSTGGATSMSPSTVSGASASSLVAANATPVNAVSDLPPVKKAKKKTFELEEISRWTMVKRIF